jgi:hypothetical protein
MGECPSADEAGSFGHATRIKEMLGRFGNLGRCVLSDLVRLPEDLRTRLIAEYQRIVHSHSDRKPTDPP